jgi:hypothetical protein
MEHFAIALNAMGDESLSVGTRARVHTGAWWAHACWTMGDFARAADLAAEATAYAKASGHRYSLVVGLAFEAITHQLLDERSSAWRPQAMSAPCASDTISPTTTSGARSSRAGPAAVGWACNSSRRACLSYVLRTPTFGCRTG